jgi:hypothetical protein
MVHEKAFQTLTALTFYLRLERSVFGETIGTDQVSLTDSENRSCENS